MTIYQLLKSAGQELESHESDLYVKITDDSIKIVNNYKFRNNVTSFISKIDGEPWFDIPFAFDPFWERIGKL
jgi:hypothetical protein